MYFALNKNPLTYRINQLTTLYQFPKLAMSAKAPLLINRAIYTRKNKTRLKEDANFPYKRHNSSKIRRGLGKTRLIR